MKVLVKGEAFQDYFSGILFSNSEEVRCFYYFLC